MEYTNKKNKIKMDNIFVISIVCAASRWFIVYYNIPKLANHLTTLHAK